MSSSSAVGLELFSLQLKYEHVCQKESEAVTRNLSLREDLARVKLKLAASSSCEARAQRLKHLKVKGWIYLLSVIVIFY